MDMLFNIIRGEDADLSFASCKWSDFDNVGIRADNLNRYAFNLTSKSITVTSNSPVMTQNLLEVPALMRRGRTTTSALFS